MWTLFIDHVTDMMQTLHCKAPRESHTACTRLSLVVYHVSRDGQPEMSLHLAQMKPYHLRKIAFEADPVELQQTFLSTGLSQPDPESNLFTVFIGPQAVERIVDLESGQGSPSHLLHDSVYDARKTAR